MLTMDGTASEVTNRPTGAVVILTYFSFCKSFSTIQSYSKLSIMNKNDYLRAAFRVVYI